MPLISDKDAADAWLRDRLAEGDAARHYARTRDLPPGWLHEIMKRLLIQLERTLKGLEDSSAKGTLFSSHAPVIDRLLQSLVKLNRTEPGRALFEKAMAESDDRSELKELARRLRLAPPAEEEESLFGLGDPEPGAGVEPDVELLGSSSAAGAER